MVLFKIKMVTYLSQIRRILKQSEKYFMTILASILPITVHMLLHKLSIMSKRNMVHKAKSI